MGQGSAEAEGEGHAGAPPAVGSPAASPVVVAAVLAAAAGCGVVTMSLVLAPSTMPTSPTLAAVAGGLESHGVGGRREGSRLTQHQRVHLRTKEGRAFVQVFRHEGIKNGDNSPPAPAPRCERHRLHRHRGAGGVSGTSVHGAASCVALAETAKPRPGPGAILVCVCLPSKRYRVFSRALYKQATCRRSALLYGCGRTDADCIHTGISFRYFPRFWEACLR